MKNIIAFTFILFATFIYSQEAIYMEPEVYTIDSTGKLLSIDYEPYGVALKSDGENVYYAEMNDAGEIYAFSVYKILQYEHTRKASVYLVTRKEVTYYIRISRKRRLHSSITDTDTGRTYGYTGNKVTIKNK